MPRGYRLAILAAFGCLAASPAYNHRQRDHGDHSKAQARVGVSPPATLPPSINANDGKGAGDGCVGKGGQHLSCETLSAQSSYDQARYAWDQAIIGGVQTLIVLGALIAAWRAAHWAREAARHTDRGANEAKRSADAAFLSQRPWLDVKVTIKGVASEREGLAVRAKLELVNGGNTPATDIRICAAGCLLDVETTNVLTSFAAMHKSRDDQIAHAILAARKGITDIKQQGRGLFPSDTMDYYTEWVVRGTENGINMCWIAAAIAYKFAGGSGETVKVFWARTLDPPNQSGFDFVGDSGLGFTDCDELLEPWREMGHIA